ncbi:MAG TPA: amidase [Xanthobacteraceae bacterium]|nr:amidase [Xanthobacteraceae bacterium]
MPDIAFASAKRLADLIAKKKVGCVELLDHYVARVEKYNPTINAIIATDIPAARKQAKAADRAIARGESRGPLHGVPMTVKEAFDVKGLPTTWGVPGQRGSMPTTNALAVDRLTNAGAVIFGKTNVPAWLADGQSYNDIYGVTKNPWDTSRTPGGSSGGSAAALASGMTGLELGSDIASSIRNPSHHCGTFGHKPSYGICPPRGHTLNGRLAADDINSIGPMARSAADLDIALAVIAGPDEIDAGAFALALPAPRKKRLKDFRIGIMFDDPAAVVEPQVQEVMHTLAAFLSKAGVKIDDKTRPVPMEDAKRVFAQLLRGATSHRQTDKEFAENLAKARKLAGDDDSPAARVLRAQVQHHRDWLAAHEERVRMRWAWHEYFKTYDLLLAPSFPVAAHPHLLNAPPAKRVYTVRGKTYSMLDQLIWAGYAGVAYQPASAAPAGLTGEGLPVGVQIIGPYGADRTCIRFARLLEKEYRAFVPPPGYE